MMTAVQWHKDNQMLKLNKKKTFIGKTWNNRFAVKKLSV